MTALTQPLTEDEIARLDDFLHGLNHGKAMTLEEMDGFFCALICCPDPVPLSEYLPHILGGELVQGCGFKSIAEAEYIMNLLARHWNTIAETLLRDDPHAVLIKSGNQSDCAGGDWARGFELGMSLRDDSWNRFIDDDQFAVALVPIVALAEARNPDSGLGPMTPDVQEDAVGALALSVLIIYRYFRNSIPGGTLAASWESRAFTQHIVH